MQQVKFKRLTATAKLPTRATSGSAGLDLYADLEGPVYLNPGHRRLIPTGVAMAIPEGYEGQVRPRSGMSLKHGVAAFFGTIDADYRGQVGVVLVNHGHETFVVSPGDRIAQLIIAPVAMLEPVEADKLDATDRGSGGFGSSGR